MRRVDTTIDISKIAVSQTEGIIGFPVSNRAIDQSNSALPEIVRTQNDNGIRAIAEQMDVPDNQDYLKGV